MHEMTQANLEAAFAGESQAHMKYKIFADKAEEEGYPQVARLFRAISFAEQVHATNHFRQLQGIGETADNLGVAIGGENYENTEMYPSFNAVAKLQGEKGAMLSIHYALEAEKIHVRRGQEQGRGGRSDRGRTGLYLPRLWVHRDRHASRQVPGLIDAGVQVRQVLVLVPAEEGPGQGNAFV
jgi:hypothetical protein